METVFGTAFEYKLIYVFAINDEAHKGLLKIGDTTIQSDASIDALFPNCKALNQAALSRIKQYTNTAGISAQLLHTELAVRLVRGKDGQQVLKAFRDHDVHRVLENSGIPKKKLKNSTSREWFEVDLATVQKAIEAVKKCQPNLSGRYRVYSHRVPPGAGRSHRENAEAVQNWKPNALERKDAFRQNPFCPSGG